MHCVTEYADGGYAGPPAQAQSQARAEPGILAFGPARIFIKPEPLEAGPEPGHLGQAGAVTSLVRERDFVDLLSVFHERLEWECVPREVVALVPSRSMPDAEAESLESSSALPGRLARRCIRSCFGVGVLVCVPFE